MARRVPTFKRSDEAWHADTCAPLSEAVERGEVRLETLARGNYPGEPIQGHALSGVRTVGYWDAKQPQAWGLDWHRNEGIEFTFLETGRLDFATEDQSHELLPGRIAITRPWQLHRIGNPTIGPSRLLWMILDVGVRQPNQEWRWPNWIILTKEDLAELTAMLRHNEQSVWRASEAVSQCFHSIAHAVESHRQECSYSRLAVSINELLLLLLNMFRENKIELDASLSSTQRMVEMLLAQLRRDLDMLSHPWTVKELAQYCELGVTRFSHYCRQLTNMTPMEFLTRYRLDAAVELLESDENSITDVAMRCGFGSSQYFATVFRRRYGVSPRMWRKSGSESRKATSTQIIDQ